MAEEPRLEEYTALEDAKLVKLVRDGDEMALSVLFDRYTPTVRMFSRTNGVAGIEPEDLMQEGMLGLFSAVLTIDPQQAASFKTYANVCIRRRISSARRLASGKKHLPLSGYLSLSGDSPACTLVNDQDNPEEQTISSEDISRIQKLIEEKLSDLERKVLERYLNGETYEAIAWKLGISPKTVDNALQRIRRKLQTVHFT